MDTVFIRDLKIDTVIGVYDWEREVRQTVSMDLEMAFDNRRAAETEDVAHALDYAAVSARLSEFVSAQRFRLLEAMGEQCAELVMREFGVPWLRLRLSKPGAVMAAQDVGLIIERGSRLAHRDTVA